MMETKRRIDIDIAKGIGIILVVWAHAYGPGIRFITQFHMPFFFFISGMLYSSESCSAREYMIRKGRSLLLPFWWWNLLLYPLYFVLYYWKNWSIEVFAREVSDILLTVEKVPFLGATWFLPALFWVSSVMHLTVRVLRKNKYGDLILFVTGVAVCALGFSVTFPHRISRTLICSFFYVSGYLYQKNISARLGERIKNAGALVGGVLFIVIASVNEVSLGGNQYRYPVAFIVGAFAAAFFVLRLSAWLLKMNWVWMSGLSKHLAYIGKNSLSIVIWHLLMFRVPILIQMIMTQAEIKAITAFPVYDASGIWWLVYLVAGIYLSLGWQYVLNHNSLSPVMRKRWMIYKG